MNSRYLTTAFLIAVYSQTLVAAEDVILYQGREFHWVNPFAADADIPQGVFHGTFSSPSMQRDVGYSIYLPPQYDENPQDRFPVVYYLHGGRPGSESGSIFLANFFNEAMSSGETPPAIYVFVNGGVISHYNYAPLNSMAEDLFIKELIPHIDSHYRTVADRKGRAIQGFSQGGRGTTRIMFKYPELFSSGAPGGAAYSVEKSIAENGGVEFDERMRNPMRLDFGEGNDAYSLAKEYAHSDAPRIEIALYGGTEGFNYDSIIEYMTYLDSLDISYKTYTVGGVGHSSRQLYGEIGIELMNFHYDAFTLEE